MSGNVMWLVCAHHPERKDALLLAERTGLSPYEGIGTGNRLQKWLTKHSACGCGLDHFTVAYDQAKDWDLPTPTPLADAVHAVLRDPPDAANS